MSTRKNISNGKFACDISNFSPDSLFSSIYRVESALKVIQKEQIEHKKRRNRKTFPKEGLFKIAFILCVPDSLLGHLLTDFDEAVGVYRVDPELEQRHIFDFRFQLQTGIGPVLRKPEVPIIKTGS